MFSKSIDDTVLTGEASDRLFSNITATNTLDQSFLATLRALLHKRLPQNEFVRLTCMQIFLTANDMTLMSTSECMSRFIPHGVLYPVSNERCIHIVYTTRLDAFERYVGNHNGYLYSQINPVISKSQMEKLYRSIFGECTYKLRICAAYTANMRTGLIGYQYYSFPVESKTYLPNPHIQRFGCIGTYAARFQEYMHKKDYVGVIDQAVVSARNLNFYDSAVMSVFADELSRTAIKCIEKPDGTLLTPQEVIQELEGFECRDPS